MNKLQWKLHYREQRISSKEEWKPVIGYEGLYEVSSFGRVRSLNYRRTGYIKLLLPGNNNKGYLRITLFKEGSQKYEYIHRLVAQAFISNIENKKEVNHKSGVTYDNRVQNLEWNTRSENTKHSYKYLGRIKNCKDKFGSQHTRAKSIIQFDKSWNFIRLWGSSVDAHRALGISQSHISECCMGKLKSTGGYKWKFNS